MSISRHHAAVLATGLGAIAVVVAVPRLMPGINATTAGFALLLVVLATATIGPFWAAITVAIAATMAFNFFFFHPVGTLAIDEPENWIALLAFLVVAVIASQLSAAAQGRAREAVARRHELESTLLASLSHDLKTPLTAVRVAVDNLRGELPAGERRAQADAAVAELVRLTRLFEDILDMARIDAATLHLERQWVTPADVVDAALAQVRPTISGHALRIGADAERAVHIDPRVASVSLAHLVENAARYSPTDREIAIEARADGAGLHVTVTDHGPGLAAGEIDHVFERFFRGRSAQTVAPGSGMGLAITRGLLNAVGGRVWAENAPGAGARFSILVPGATRRQPAVND